MLPGCDLCRMSVDLAPGIARGRAGIYVHADTGQAYCLGHAALMRCTCGWEVISCSIAGCGAWKPVNLQTEILGQQMWDATHESAENEDGADPEGEDK